MKGLDAGQDCGLVDGGAGDAGGDSVPLRPAELLAVLLVLLGPDLADVVAQSLLGSLVLVPHWTEHLPVMGGFEYFPVLGGVEPKP